MRNLLTEPSVRVNTTSCVLASCLTVYLPNPGTERHRFATSAPPTSTPIYQRATNRMVPAPPSEGNRDRHSQFCLRDGPILLQRGVIPARDSAGWLSPPVGGRGQLARDSATHTAHTC